MRPIPCFPNPFGRTGFIFGWQPALLGNCLTTLASLIVFSVRNAVPAIYPNIDDYRELFADPDASRKIFDRADVLPRAELDDFSMKMSQRLRQDAVDTVWADFPDLGRFTHAQGISVLLSESRTEAIRDWRDDDMERRTGAFCGNGNGVILRRTFWNQYTDMRLAGAYADVLRKHLGTLRPDTLSGRADHMSARQDQVKIAIHIRLGDYEDWHGGKFFFTREQYFEVMKRLDLEFSATPHTFYIFSEFEWHEADFSGLPVLAMRGHYMDDFAGMSKCDYIVGPPSTFGTWSAFFGRTKRIILTRERIDELAATHSLLNCAVDIPFPTGAYLPDDPMGRPV